MKAIARMLVPAAIAVAVAATGCASHDRDALYQPMEPNWANPADPLERQVEDERSLDARGQTEVPVLTVPEPDAVPPEEPDPDTTEDEPGRAGPY